MSDSNYWQIPKMGSTSDLGKMGYDYNQSLGSIRIGNVILDRFEIEEQIGQGGMGVVFRAQDRNRNGHVALKFLHPSLLSEPRAIRMFKREAELAAKLNHPRICQVYDVQEVEGVHFLVMELLEGESLRSHLRTLGEKQERMNIDLAMDLIEQIAEALEHAHEWTYHLDLKPENVWLTPGGEIRVMDFGISRLLRPGKEPAARESVTQLRLGTPYYTAPEQLTSSSDVDQRADVYSLAVLTYELLTGDPPLNMALELKEVRWDLPVALSEVVKRGLAVKPEDRYLSVAAFAKALSSSRREYRFPADFLRAHPVLRRRIGWMALLVATGIAVWAYAVQMQDSFERNRTRLEQAYSALSEADRSVEEVGEELQTRQQSVLTAKEAWDDIRAPSVRASEPEIFAAKQAYQRANRIWQQLRSELNAQGDWIPGKLALERVTDRIHANRLTEAIQQSSQLRREAAAKLASIQRKIESAQDTDLKGALRASETILTNSEALGNTIGAGEQLETASRPGSEQQFRILWQTLKDETVGAKHAWESRFSPLGPPNLSFLYDHAQTETKANLWMTLKRYDKALPLLQESVQVYQQWTEELNALHHRTKATWDSISQANRFEFGNGMRFVRIDSAYFVSMWETRVMDFARFIDENPGLAALAGEDWKTLIPNQGPTWPVVGVEPKMAAAFASWLDRTEPLADRPGPMVNGLYRKSDIANLRDAEHAGPIRQGLFISFQEWSERRYQEKIVDLGIDPARHLGPVARGKPSPRGVYDLQGSVWEWSEVPFLNSAGHYAWKNLVHFPVLYGGDDFGVLSELGLPSPEGYDYIVNLKAIGFRVMLR
jgi:serine/threonine protein kinase